MVGRGGFGGLGFVNGVFNMSVSDFICCVSNVA
jgi:hypothetical protein